jgi:hypothetical protein
MADVPRNQRLWDSLVSQAKSKFKTWPSIPASTWVRKQYTQHGGTFVDSKRVTAEKKKREAAKDRGSGKKSTKK